MRRMRLLAWAAVALAAAACSSSGRYTPPPEPPPLAIERLDRPIAFAVDPGLDATAFSYECGLGGEATYDYGDALGQQVRAVFEQRYSQAIEVAPELADVVVAYRGATLEFRGEQGVLTYHVSYRLFLHLAIIAADGETSDFTVTGRSQDDVFRSFFDVCGSGAEMIERLTPELLKNLAKSLAVRLN